MRQMERLTALVARSWLLFDPLPGEGGGGVGGAEGKERCLSRQVDLPFLTACLRVQKRLLFFFSFSTIVFLKTHPELSGANCVLSAFKGIVTYGVFCL